MINQHQTSSAEENYACLYKKLEIGDTQFLAFKNLAKYFNDYGLSNCSILDYGCGAGKSTRFLRQFSSDVTGLDVNQAMIDAAIMLDDQSQYLRIKSGEIPSLDNYYDFVFSSWVLVEISTKEEMLVVLQEIYRVLKPGGIYITVVCNENTYKRRWRSLKGDFEENQSLYSGKQVKVYLPQIDLTIYDYYWTHEDYLEFFELSNLKLQKFDLVLAQHGEKGVMWQDEEKYPPYTSYILQKN